MFSGCGSLRNCSSHLNFESLLFKSDHKITIMLTSRCLISPQTTKNKVPIQPLLSSAFLLGTGLIQNNFFMLFREAQNPCLRIRTFQILNFPLLCLSMSDLKLHFINDLPFPRSTKTATQQKTSCRPPLFKL